MKDLIKHLTELSVIESLRRLPDPKPINDFEDQEIQALLRLRCSFTQKSKQALLVLGTFDNIVIGHKMPQGFITRGDLQRVHDIDPNVPNHSRVQLSHNSAKPYTGVLSLLTDTTFGPAIARLYTPQNKTKPIYFEIDHPEYIKRVGTPDPAIRECALKFLGPLKQPEASKKISKPPITSQPTTTPTDASVSPAAAPSPTKEFNAEEIARALTSVFMVDRTGVIGWFDAFAKECQAVLVQYRNVRVGPIQAIIIQMPEYKSPKHFKIQADSFSEFFDEICPTNSRPPRELINKAITSESQLLVSQKIKSIGELKGLLQSYGVDRKEALLDHQAAEFLEQLRSLSKGTSADNGVQLV